MSSLIKRRHFLQSATAATLSVALSKLTANARITEEYVEAIVIGSGFGGAVASLRLGQAGIETIVLERGRRWPITPAGDTFCTHENPDGRSTWLKNATVLGNPVPIPVYTGVLDLKVGQGTNVWRGAGVGGSSLVYNGMSYQPNKRFFEQIFPRSINYDELDKVYYPRVRSIIQPAPIPDDILQSPYYLSSRVFAEQATRAGFTPRKLDVAVDWDIVRQEIAGQKVPSAILGQIFYGINSGAKKSLDQNYLKMAEATGNVEIRPLHVVTLIEELEGKRFRVYCNQINEQGVVVSQKSLICRYLFLAAGSIGTTELLLRGKAKGTLKRLNDQVGKFWGINGDAIGATISNTPNNPTQGGPGGIALEDWQNPISPVTIVSGPFPFLPEGFSVNLCMSIGKPEGRLTYNKNTDTADLFWPQNTANNQRNTQAVLSTYTRLIEANNLVLTGTPDSSLIAHPLGGAIIGKACNPFGQVMGYPNLFVVDGSLIPGAVGCVNPSLTIAALAERCMDRFLNRIPG
ncbi:MAG TPA: GMC oxidoreductase [Nostocaceae cyanobacterium]|nr:GMC oxidoreductase [Nostocaceae cyanobacterium]